MMSPSRSRAPSERPETANNKRRKRVTAEVDGQVMAVTCRCNVWMGGRY